MKIDCLLEQDSNKPILDADKLARYDDLANFVEELHDENMRMRQQLAEREKQIVLLRVALEMAWSTASVNGVKARRLSEEALAATADLEWLRLCHANPIAWITTDEEGSPAMLFFDKQEALMFSGVDGPVPLYKVANNRRRQAGALQRYGEPKEQGK